MQALFDYILKLSVSLALVYMFYQLLLRRLTFYNWNRWYFLGYTAFAFLIPLLNITETLDKNEWGQSMIIRYIPVIEVNEQVAAGATVSHSLTAWDWLLIMLLAGMLVLIIKFAIRYLSFLKVRRNATLIADGETKLFMVDKDIIPFSFGKNIFINNQVQDEAELKEIIRHEFVHVKQKHTHDIIWSEILCILNWYNPFIWLIRKAIRQNLEFIADNQVLEQGIDRKKYQYLLLKVTGNNHFSIANQFNLSSLKKRIAMMNKMKSARAQLIKFLFIVPLVAVMLLAFRNEGDRGSRNGTLANNTWQAGDFTDSVPDAGTNERLLPPPPPPVPPGPPAPPAGITLPSNVKSLTMTGDKLRVVLKDGTVEKYDFTREEDKKAFNLKYGKLFVPPPPPPPPPHAGAGYAPSTVVIDTSNVYEYSPKANITVGVGSTIYAPGKIETEIQKVTILPAPAVAYTPATINTKVTAPVEVNGATYSTISISPAIGVNSTEYVTTTLSGANGPATLSTASVIPPSGATNGSISKKGEKLLELKIFKSASNARLEEMIAEAKAKGVELKFDIKEYDRDNQLTRLAGKLEKGESKNVFSASDFEVLTLTIYVLNGKYSFFVNINKQKEII